MADQSKTRMGGDQKGGMIKKSLGDSGLAKATASPALKSMSQKGIMGKGGSLAAGSPLKRPSLKGFGSGGKVQP